MLFTLGRLPCPTAAEATGGLKDWPTPGFPPGHSAPSGAAPLPPCHLPTVIHTDNRADALKPRWPPSLQPCGSGSSPATVHGPALGPAQRQGHSSVLRVLPNLEDHAVSSVINPLETSLPPSCLLPVLQDPSLSLCSGKPPCPFPLGLGMPLPSWTTCARHTRPSAVPTLLVLTENGTQ